MSEPQCAPRMIDLRLAPAAAATWAATRWATDHPAPWAVICVCVLASLSCAASYARSHRGRKTPRHALTPPRSARLGLALLLACTACALAVGSTARRQYDADPARRDPGPIHARLVLQTDPAPASSGFSATRSARVRIEAVSVGEVWLPSSATALVRAPGWGDAARGDVYEVWGSRDTTLAADVPSIGTIRVRRAQLIERPGGLPSWTRATHHAFSHACTHLSRDARALVPGMAIGDDRGMPADLSDAMKKTSLTHLTAVSGSHLVIILATITLTVPARKPLRLHNPCPGHNPHTRRTTTLRRTLRLRRSRRRPGTHPRTRRPIHRRPVRRRDRHPPHRPLGSTLLRIRPVGARRARGRRPLGGAGAAVPPTNPRRHARRESAASARGDGVRACLRGAGDRAAHRVALRECAGVGHRCQRSCRARRSGRYRRRAHGRARLPAEYSRRLGMRCRCVVGDRVDRRHGAHVRITARKRGARARWLLNRLVCVRLLRRWMDRVAGMEEMGIPDL